MAITFSICMAKADDYSSYYKNLPVNITQATAPVIPNNTVNIKDFGGVGDGLTLNTEAFRKAISALNKKGGGHLVVPSGIWLCGLISLKDNIDLHLEKNAILLASPDKNHFIKEKDGKKDTKCSPMISASKRKNISITGEGIIDGNGAFWRPVKRSKVSDTEWKEFTYMGGTEAEEGKLWFPFNLKNYGNVANTPEAQEKMRTHLIRVTDCENVLISGVTIQNSPKFHLIPTRCTNVIVDGVTIRCPWNAQNGDGLDISSCKNVLVVNNTIDVGDDGDPLPLQKGEVVADERLHARVLQPDGVEDDAVPFGDARRGVAEARFKRQTLGADAAQAGDVVDLVEFPPEPEGAAGGDDGIFKFDAANFDAKISHASLPPRWETRARLCRRGRGSRPIFYRCRRGRRRCRTPCALPAIHNKGQRCYSHPAPP